MNEIISNKTQQIEELKQKLIKSTEENSILSNKVIMIESLLKENESNFLTLNNQNKELKEKNSIINNKMNELEIKSTLKTISEESYSNKSEEFTKLKSKILDDKSNKIMIEMKNKTIQTLEEKVKGMASSLKLNN